MIAATSADCKRRYSDTVHSYASLRRFDSTQKIDAGATLRPRMGRIRVVGAAGLRATLGGQGSWLTSVIAPTMVFVNLFGMA